MHSLSDNVKIVAVLQQFSLPLQHAVTMMRQLSKYRNHHVSSRYGGSWGKEKAARKPY